MEPSVKYRHDRPDGMAYRDSHIPRPNGYDRYGRNDRGGIEYYPQPRMYSDERMPDGPYRPGPWPVDGRPRSRSPYMMGRRTPPPYGYYEPRPYLPPSPPPPYGPPPPRYRDGPPPPPMEYYDRPRSPRPMPMRRSRSPPPTNMRRERLSSHPEHSVAPEEDPQATRTLFVGNVDNEISSDELKRVFEPFGVVEEVKLKPSAQAQSNPYAFVRFFNLNQAYIAKVEMAGKLIGRFRCRIGYGRAIPTNCVWIGGLGTWLSKQDLEKEFSRFGRMTRVVWPGRADYAYIVYDSIDSARKAVDEMRGFVFRGSSVRLRTDFSEVGQIDQPGSDGHKRRSSERRVSTRRAGSYSPPPIRKRSHSSVDRPKREVNNRVHHHRGNGGGRISRSRSGSSVSLKKSRHVHTTRKRRKSLSSARDSPRSASDRSESRGRPPAPKKDRTFQIGNIEEAGTVLDLARCLPVVWSGNLMLKNQSFSTRLYRVSGQLRLIDMLMDCASADDKTLKITQRLRMDESKLEEVRRRIALSGPDGWNILLAVPGSAENRRGVGKTDCLADLVAYLREKKAAGVLALPPDCKQGCESGLLHIFPSCKFVHKYLLEHAPKLVMDYTTEDYMIVFLVSITA